MIRGDRKSIKKRLKQIEMGNVKKKTCCSYRWNRNGPKRRKIILREKKEKGNCPSSNGEGIRHRDGLLLRFLHAIGEYCSRKRYYKERKAS